MNRTEPELVFPEGWDDRIAEDCLNKGYCSVAQVIMPDGSRRSVFFITPQRAVNDCADSMCICEAGMFIVREASVENMKLAIAAAWREDLLDSLAPTQTVRSLDRGLPLW